MTPGVLLFAGAPESNSLIWDHGLLNDFSEPFSRFAKLNVPQDASNTSEPSSSPQPAWRSIPLERQHLETGHSQNHGWQKEFQGAEFFTTDSFIEEMSQPSLKETRGSIAESTDQAISQFYEQSYAVHEDIASSQIAATSDAGSSVYTDSFGATNTFYESQPNSFTGHKDIPVAHHLSNLKDMPNGRYLDSIQPQTMTVDLVIGIIQIPAPRAIKTRRGDNVELIEILVGDETKSGFGVNFWLSSHQSAKDPLRATLIDLRPQDIVLMRHVALSSFRGKVYGQSLRKGMTKVHLLHRNRIDKSDPGGCYNSTDLAAGGVSNPQIDKTRRVREWVLRFVGAGTVRQAEGRVKAIKETLPPDTQ